MKKVSDYRRSKFTFGICIGRRAPVRALGVALVVAVMLAMLAPLMSQSAAAADNQRDLTSEDIDADLDDMVAEDPTDYYLGIYINKLECADAYGHDVYELAANCGAPTGQYEFVVYGPNFQGDYVNGVWQEGLPGGDYRIREILPQGFGEPIVFCKTIDAYGYESEYGEVVTYEGYYELSLASGQSLYCDWFNVNPYFVSNEPSSIYINKLECPEDYGNDIYAFAANCYEPTTEVEWEVFGPNTTEYFTGDVSLDQVPPGDWRIHEFIPSGYGTPVVFCNESDFLGNNDTGFQEVVVYDGYYEFQLKGGRNFYCDWYNIPYNPGGTEHTPDDDAGKIIIYKFFCPEYLEFDPYYAELYDLSYACGEYGDGIEFELYGEASGETASAYTGETESGAASFSVEEEGTYYLTEELGHGYGKPVVFCAYLPAEGGESMLAEAEWFAYDVYDQASIGVKYEYGYTLVCFWFNIPEYDEYGSVTIFKYFCYEGGYEYDFEWYFENCSEPGKDITFKLDSASTGNPGEQTTNEYGEVVWSDLEADTYYLTEYAPEGYGKPVIFCTFLSEDQQSMQGAEFFPLEVYEQYRAEFELKYGYHLVCYWFNIPDYEDEGTLDVYKWICPDGYSFDELYEYDLGELQELCYEAHEGVDFYLDGPHGQEGRTTDNDGSASWDGLGLGEYELWEEIPDGYGYPIVWCGFTAFYNGAVYDGFPQPVDLYDGTTYEFEIEIPGSKYFCFWFNIPDYHDGGEVIVYKYFCYEGGYEYDLEWYFENCTEPGKDISFKLDSASTGNPGNQETDENGFASWSGLEADEYYLSEDVPSGYGKPVVYCTYVYGDAMSLQDAEFFPLDVYEQYSVEFDLEYGYRIVCFWFNIPEYDDEGTVTIYKFFCYEGGYEYDPEWYFENCTEPGKDITFELFGDESGSQGERETDEDGYATWYGLEEDDYTLTEYAPEGYGKPVVFCTYVYGDAFSLEGAEFFPYDVYEQYSIEFKLEYGYHLVCYWFNIPDYDDGGKVVITKWYCPEGYNPYELSLDELKELCWEVYEGVDFHLVDGYGNDWERETDEYGKATWDNLEPGEYGLWEELPEGYGEPIVYCWLGVVEASEGLGYAESPEYQNVYEGAAIGFELDYGWTWYCDWFNVPYHDEDGSITIYKWLCPEGYDLYDEHANPWEDCDKKHNGVEFEIDGPGYHDEQETGDYISGAVKWDELEAGLYQIEEHLTDEIAYGFVLYCEGGYFPEVYPLYSTESGEPFVVELEYGQHIVCDWFNVPYDYDETAWVTIYKYWCDGYYISELNCELYTGGQKFILSSTTSGDEYELTTGGSGKVTIEVPEGTWDLEEVGREWCRAESDDVNHEGELETWNGHETVVIVFNCSDEPGNPGNPGDPPTKQGPPTKLPDTGSGDAATSLAELAGSADTQTLGFAVAGLQLAGLVGLAARRIRRAALAA